MKIFSQIIKILFVCFAFSTYGLKDASCQDWIRVYGQNTYRVFALQAKETYDKGYLIRNAFRKYEITNEQSAIFYSLPFNVIGGELLVTDIEGRMVTSFQISGSAGQKVWDTRQVDKGIYVYTLKAGNMGKQGKLIIQ